MTNGFHTFTEYIGLFLTLLNNIYETFIYWYIITYVKVLVKYKDRITHMVSYNTSLKRLWIFGARTPKRLLIIMKQELKELTVRCKQFQKPLVAY